MKTLVLMGPSVEALDRLVSYILDIEGEKDSEIAELAAVLADELAQVEES